MRVAIIGRGTAGVIQALMCLQFRCQVDIYFDPDQPPLNVGESSTPHIGNTINQVLGITIGNLVDEGVASHKLGIEFINWGKGATFRHYFHSGIAAFQFQTKILNAFLEERLKERGVRFIPQRVKSHNVREGFAFIDNTPYDFIIYCTGWHEDDYMSPPLETVNSAILYKKNYLEKEPVYTLHEATEHGWQFGLPFPDLGETRHGYLYNNKINTKEEVINKLKTEKGVEDFKSIEWVPRQSSVMIKDMFHAYNGNRLLFNEPLQALSLMIYDHCAFQIASFLQHRDPHILAVMNRDYLSFVKRYYESVAFHYQFGSIFESPFWKQKQKEAQNLFFGNLENNMDNLFTLYNHDMEIGLVQGFDNVQKNELLSVGTFKYNDFKDLYEGMTQTKIPKKVN